MPVYIYGCSNCNSDFERELPYGSTLKPRCPKCKKGKQVRKKIGVVSISFKGEGFTRSISENG